MDFRRQLLEIIAQRRQISASLDNAMLRLTERIEKLVASQAHTDRRLDALIGVVDGIVRHPPAPSE